MNDVQSLEEIIAAGRASPAVVRRIRGRLQFACSQTFGRCGAFASRALRDLACGSGGHRKLADLELAGISWWKEYLLNARPREVRVLHDLPPVLIFTDGAVEDIVSVGGVLFDRVSGRFEFFGTIVPDDVSASWGRGCGQLQVIGQAELAPLVLAVHLWRRILAGRSMLAFVDNDSAKDAAIRGYSPSLPSAHLVSALWQCLAAVGAMPWFDRVPGLSNLADAPSRLQFSHLHSLGAQRRQVDHAAWSKVHVCT